MKPRKGTEWKEDGRKKGKSEEDEEEGLRAEKGRSDAAVVQYSTGIYGTGR